MTDLTKHPDYEKWVGALYDDNPIMSYYWAQNCVKTVAPLIWAEARREALEEAAIAVINAAPIIDHPSVYMGGPSLKAKRNAEEFARIIRVLVRKGDE